MKNALSSARLGQDRNSILPFVALAGAIWLYLVLRAFHVPLIHDEAATFEAYMMYGTFLPPHAYWDANNHLLNSMVGALTYKLFGFSFLSIRLLGIITFPVYAFFTFRLGKLISGVQVTKWLFYLGMLCTPFAIEFFGLARGYGAALACFTGYLFYTFQSFRQPGSTANYLKLVGFGFFTIAANFSFFSGVFIMALLLFTKWLLYKELNIKTLLARSAGFTLVILPWVWWILELKTRGLLYYGGSELIPFFLEPMEQMYFCSNAFRGLTLIPFLLAGVAVLRSILKNGTEFLKNPEYLFSWALILALGWIFFLQIALGVNYPEDRAALYFFPLIIGSLTEKLPGIQYKSIPLQALLLLWPVFDLASSFNFTHSRLWFKEHIPSAFYTAIRQEHSGNIPPTISGYKLRESNWPFGMFNAPNPLVISASGFPNKHADFILASNRWKEELPKTGFDTLITDAASKQFVLMRKTPQTYSSIADTSFTLMETNAEYLNLLEFLGEDVPKKPLRLTVSLKPVKEETILPITLIASAFNEDGSTLYYEVLIGSHLGDQWGELGEITLCQVLPGLPSTAQRLVVYLYNPGKETYAFPTVKATLESIEVKLTEPKK